VDINSLRDRGAISPLSVSELNGYIKNIFDNDRTLTAVSVKGEISNFTYHRSGHLYFSLKDSDGQIRAVMFRSSAARLKFMPENGMRVIVRGSVSVYSRDGSYQLYVNSMQPDGIGALYLAYEQLKERLSNEGLFAAEHKKTLPEYPERIGVITSPTGAAVRDIINVTQRRYPLAKIYIYPALVQGDGAESSLIGALDYFEKSRLADVIIIGRGGGSIEDLWAFNSELLARKIFSLTIPVISAVGHETDFTICDFVSDLRAPTPSAAAEIAVPDIREILMRIDTGSERAVRALIRSYERARERLNIITERELFTCFDFITSPMREVVDDLSCRSVAAITDVQKEKRTYLTLLLEKLNALNPLKVLERGYSITESNGKQISSVKNLKVGDSLTLRFADGNVWADVNGISNDKNCFGEII